ncbi:Nn.00g039860.m01.CDS01 [Neocucurbitaria sp. VM-36]
METKEDSSASALPNITTPLDLRSKTLRHGAANRPTTDAQSSSDASSTFELEDNRSYLIVHVVECDRLEKTHSDHPILSQFFDTPRLFTGDNKLSALRGKRRIANVQDVLEENNEIQFVVYRRYECSAYHFRIKNDFEQATMPKINFEARSKIRPYLSMLISDGPSAALTKEWIEIVDDSLHEAMKRADSTESGPFKGWMNEEALKAPYLGFFHSRHDIDNILMEGFEEQHQQSARALFEFVQESCQEEYEDADAMFAEGKVNKKHYNKLFAPNTVLVRRKDDNILGIMTKGFPSPTDNHAQTWYWSFDGLFRNEIYWLELTWPGSEEEQMAITDLPAYPLKFDKNGLHDQLRRRGRTFWDCRKRKYVSYSGPSTGSDFQIAPPRYMIDIDTYRRMHSDEDLKAREKDDLSEETMNSDAPPEDDFVLLLPAKIQGYGFHDKKWRLLLVEHIEPVLWNKRAFDRVVLKSQKKELIKALVTVHLSTMAATDVIDDKGQGLIMLFHGGPGTGKTLTAETVADLAEKPLYRVTCGDIGTEPESVEKYLDSVLYIGTIWECVVLLDEADVFLEERTLTDLQRNALVSVFLRVLEYYQGIIILTSNRVGTFDEAFKSRVQLALHYPELDEKGRWEIWRNFIHGLSKNGYGEGIEMEEIRDKLDILARYKLNGRQIRNIVKTARQLAQYRKEPMAYGHIETAIEVANEFEEYLTKTHGHTDEEYAREQRTRY